MMMHIAFAAPGWRTMKIERQLDLVAAPMICGALLRSAAGEESNLFIDLEAVDAADEPGIASFIAALRRIHADHPRVRVAVLAHRPLLADILARGLPPTVAEVYRDRVAAVAAIEARAAA